MANIVQYIIDFATRGGNAVVRQATQLQSRLDAANASAGRLSLTVGKNLRNAVMSLPGASFFTNPIVAMSAGIGVVSKLGMQAETTAVSFDVLVGSQAKAANMLSQINAYAKTSPYDRLGAQEAAKTMLGFGISAESVVRDLKLLGDVAGGNNQRLQQLALVFGQISAAGKLQGQDLLQLINAGYNPLQDIAEMTGKSMSTVRDEMSAGKISIDMVRQAFVRATSEGGRYYGMIDRLSSQSAGKFGEMKDTAVEAMLAIYNVIQSMVIPAFQLLINTLNAVITVFNFITRPVKWIFDLIAAGNLILISLIAFIGTWTAAVVVNTYVLKGWRIAELAHYAALLLIEKAQRLVNAAMSANPINLIIAGISALVTALVLCWNKFAGFRAVILTVWDTVKGFAGIIKDFLVDTIASLLQGLGKLGEALSKLFHGDFSGAWQTAKDAGRLMLDVDGKKQAFNEVRSAVKGIGGNYRSRLDSERQKQDAKDGISEPEAAAGTVGDDLIGPVLPTDNTDFAPTSGGTDAGKIANDITTGGTRNTSINITIGSMLQGFTIHTSGIQNTSDEIKDKVVEAVNRALEIGLSVAR